MDWYVIDKNYIKYLTQFDSRVGYVEYGNRLKLHVGILLTINEFHYYVPISSPKPKHQKMSNNLDFHKLQDETTGYIYLLQKEKALIDHIQQALQNKALKLYQKCMAKPGSSLATRCCNFKMLEEKCNSYSDT